MFSIHNSLQGKLLVASPQLNDPNFHHAVVFICNHDDKGAFGLVINRPGHWAIRPQFEGVEEEHWLNSEEIYIGGPVNSEQVFILYSDQISNVQGKSIMDHVFLMKDLDEIPVNVDSDLLKKELKIFMGFSGWSQNQLEAEVLSGAWKVMGARKDWVFSQDSDKIWKSSLECFGGSLGILGKMPGIDDIINN